MSAHVCTGCTREFFRMHQLRDHRHTFRCGGLWKAEDQVTPIYEQRPLEPKLPKRRARTPGTVRPSRMPGGSGFRNNWQGPVPCTQ